jgi:NIMA-interacting peptidyl-prolyl cis-trans isomerase 4
MQGKGALKAATAVNVRHILCEKHGKATEALQKIQVSFLPFISAASAVTNRMYCPHQEGQRFDKVAQEYSEDKAKSS